MRYFHKLFSFLIGIILSIQVYSQVKEGFDKNEAIDMIRLCNSYTFLELYNDDTGIVPENYEKYYTSGVFGMDNKFQIYLKDSTAIINFRGSTDKQISWLENFNSAMIPAKGIIYIEGDKFEYCFAQDTNASVHSGFALGIAYLHRDLLFHLKNLNRLGYYNFIITGHSQGGALSNLLRAYLENLPEGIISNKNKFKTYAFAAPMIGNKSFMEEYNSRYCKPGLSFNIVNPKDPVPKLPTSYNDSSFTADNLGSYISDPSSVSFKSLARDAAYLLFEKSLTSYIQRISMSTTRKITKELGNVVLPGYTNEINFSYLGNVVKIPPVNYPKILKDSTILQNDSLMAIYIRDEDGIFLNQDVYKSEPFAFQHKTYNYYTSVLLKFFPEQYAKLEKKFLIENL
jgi:hypothetical protein